MRDNFLPRQEEGEVNMNKMLKLGLVAFALIMVLGILPASAQKVAVMGEKNPAWNTEVQNKLIATGLFTTVDVYDLTVVTPTLEQMEGYNAILVYTDNPPPVNPTTFGDNLANYVDGGGGVVAAVFATAGIPITGRFNTDNYWAIQPTGSQSGQEETLGTIFVPEHPILNGVTTFDGGTSSYRPETDSLHPTATRVANWTGPGNIPLIATRVINGVRRADLGFFPPSNDSRSDFWIKTTDGAKIMSNALLWVALREEGTIGTEITITGSGFGARKGKALVGTAALKILDWTDSSIRCQLTKALSPGIYDVTIRPKGASPIIMLIGFVVKAPEIDSVDPTGGSAGDTITIYGSFFVTKKGKVTLGGKNCKVLNWTMDPTTGESEIEFVVPKRLTPGVNELKIINGVGSDTIDFTVE